MTGRRPRFPGVWTEDACVQGVGGGWDAVTGTALNVQTGGEQLENFAAPRLQGTARSSSWPRQTGGKVKLGKLRM